MCIPATAELILRCRHDEYLEPGWFVPNMTEYCDWYARVLSLESELYTRLFMLGDQQDGRGYFYPGESYKASQPLNCGGNA